MSNLRYYVRHIAFVCIIRYWVVVNIKIGVQFCAMRLQTVQAVMGGRRPFHCKSRVIFNEASTRFYALIYIYIWLIIFHIKSLKTVPNQHSDLEKHPRVGKRADLRKKMCTHKRVLLLLYKKLRIYGLTSQTCPTRGSNRQSIKKL